MTSELEVAVPAIIETHSDKWSAVTTFVPGKWLAELFEQYGTDLFSANLRGYLGSRESDANINNGIKRSAKEEPANFAIYNNGVTAITLGYEISDGEGAAKKLKVTGLSIVNGAQTTGSLANVQGGVEPALLVPIRFIRSPSEAIVENIVRFNNSQNKIEAADFRSSDSIQERLRAEFGKIDDADYEGGRRGGVSDAIKRSKFTLPSYTVAQALAAFHVDPNLAYDRKSALWTDDKTYNQIFNERTTARHIVFVYSLLQAINARRLSLVEKSKSGVKLTDIEGSVLDFLNKKGAQFLILYTVSQVLETILGKSIQNKFDLVFTSKTISPGVAMHRWDPILQVILPLCNSLDAAFSNGRVQGEGVQNAIPNFKGIFASVADLQAQKFEAFSAGVSF